jgi:hypothetical protein
MKKNLIFLSALAFLIFSANQVIACSCLFDKPSDSLKTVDVIFVGKITKVLEAKRKWQVKVSSVVKGNVPEIITFYASMVGTSCENSEFKLDEAYVFFANKIEKNEVGQSENGKISKGEMEKIGNYEPETCSWTATLTSWKSEKFKEELKEYNDANFFKIIDKGRKPKKLKNKK